MFASTRDERRLVIAILALASAPAWGQFPSQQDGRALDANSQLGSYGINAPVTGPGAPINYGNLIVTGNVTQGRSFRSFSPIRDVSTFSAGLPSAGISNFARDTVSAGQFLQGAGTTTVIRPQAFFSVEQTVPTAGAVASGLYPATGSLLSPSYQNQHVNYFSAGQTPYTAEYQPIEDTRIIDRGSALRPEIITPNDLPVGTRTVANPMLMRSQLLATNPGLADRAGTSTTEFTPFGFDSRTLYDDTGRIGVPDELDHTGLDPATRESLSGTGGETPRQVLSGVDAGASAADELRRAQQPVDYRVRMRLDENGVYRVDPAGTTPVGPGTTTNLPTQRDSNAVPQSGTSALDRIAGTPTLWSSDTQATSPSGVTGELMRPLRPGPALTEEESTLPPSALGLREMDRPSAEPPELMAGSVQPQADLIETGSVDPAEMLNQPVASFAGTADTRINEYLRTAEQHLRDEQYYRAAALYELATMVDPGNPLVWLGHGNALIAAGDYRSAIRSLLRGIEQFPDIGSFRMNLHDFIPNASLLESRRASLEAQLSTRENPEIRFLLGYIEYFTGLKDFGLANLRTAAEAVPDDSVIARFPALLDEATKSTETP
jgi:hypothetical protein